MVPPSSDIDSSASTDQSIDPPAAVPEGGHEMQVVGDIHDNCDALSQKLTAFESAWYVVHLACSKLSSDLSMAKSFTVVG